LDEVPFFFRFDLKILYDIRAVHFDHGALKRLAIEADYVSLDPRSLSERGDGEECHPSDGGGQVAEFHKTSMNLKKYFD
jgi:hypothetical protein